ncbi:MAG: hypothetical protein H0W01_01365 [Pseudonocardiales bacterium]|nr:hypothetical protein [Pseudonocardiales bacterium]
MPKNVQIRDLDDETYAVLRRRAADEDLSLTQYLRRELSKWASQPTMEELLAESDRWRDRGGGVSREALDAAIDEMRATRP